MTTYILFLSAYVLVGSTGKRNTWLMRKNITISDSTRLKEYENEKEVNDDPSYKNFPKSFYPVYGFGIVFSVGLPFAVGATLNCLSRTVDQRNKYEFMACATRTMFWVHMASRNFVLAVVVCFALCYFVL